MSLHIFVQTKVASFSLLQRPKMARFMKMTSESVTSNGNDTACVLVVSLLPLP